MDSNITLLKSFMIKNKEEATHIKNAILKYEKIKNDFLTHINQTKKELIEEINKKNKNLEIENENIIKNTIYKTEIIYQLVLSFWAFRMKNNGEK